MNILELYSALLNTDELTRVEVIKEQEIDDYLKLLEKAQKSQMLSSELKQSIRFAQAFIYQFARLSDEDKTLIIEIMKRNQWEL